MSYHSLRNPELYERPVSQGFPTPDHDHYLPICCGVPMCWDGGNEYYCDECGKEQA